MLQTWRAQKTLQALGFRTPLSGGPIVAGSYERGRLGPPGKHSTSQQADNGVCTYSLSPPVMATEYSCDNTLLVPTKELLTLAQRAKMTMLFYHYGSSTNSSGVGSKSNHGKRHNLPSADQKGCRLLDAHTWKEKKNAVRIWWFDLL